MTLDEQLAQLRESHPEAQVTARGDGTQLVHVPAVTLPSGWSKSNTNVWFVLPKGYPVAAPDCFWTDPDLRLATGQPPQNAQPQALPGTDGPKLWFSWHPARWRPNHDSLLSYKFVIERRFREVR